MADVYAVFGTLLALGIAFPGMLAAYWLLFPAKVEKAGQRLTEKPGKTFLIGLGATFAVAIPITFFFVVGLPFTSFLGVSLLVIVLAVAAIGSAGMALKMSGRLAEKVGGQKPMRNFLGAAVALELMAVFPFIGWFLVIPLTIIASLGAALGGLFGKKTTTLPEAPISIPAEA